MSHIQVSQLIQAPKHRVFQQIVDIACLPQQLSEHIEVDSLDFDEPLQIGSEIRCVMSRWHFSQCCRLRIEELLADDRLTYKQVEGLFKSWIHTIELKQHGSGDQTVVTDLVEYEMPFGLLGYLLDDLHVRRDMRCVLQSRLRALKAQCEKKTVN